LAETVRQILERAFRRKGPCNFQNSNVCTDYSSVTIPQRRIIGVQAAAQVLWYLKRGEIPYTTEMRKEIWRHEEILSFLGYIDLATGKIIYPGARRLEDAIRKVNPLPDNKRRGWHVHSPVLEDELFSRVCLIPRIFSAQNPLRINFGRLRITIIALARIQAILDRPIEEVENSPILKAYVKPLEPHEMDCGVKWSREGYHSDGSIFVN